MAKRNPQRAPQSAEQQHVARDRSTQSAVATLEREPDRQQAGGAPQPDDIARRAYEIYCERGGEHGRDMDDWLQAESELKQR